MVSAIVVAAGASRRMGHTNKMLLPYRGTTVVAHTVRQVLYAGLQEVIVVVGHEAEQVMQAVHQLPVQIVRNVRYEEGLTSSLQAGIAAASGSGYLLCLADMVKIEPGEYAQLVSTFEEQLPQYPACICLPRYQGQKGNPALFSSAYRDAWLGHGEAEGGKGLIHAHLSQVIWVDMATAHVLQDLDEPNDYERMKE